MRSLLLILALGITATASAKTYRWVDENGQVHYGDRIPAKYAQQRSQTLNSRGVVVDERNAPKTPEQLAIEEAERKAREAAEARAREQARYDSFLLSTYATQDQIISRRDDQLNILDSRIASGEKSVTQNQASLDKLRERAAKIESAGNPVPARISKQINEFEATLRSSEVALEAMRQERDKVNADFERDLNRWIDLNQQR